MRLLVVVALVVGGCGSTPASEPRALPAPPPAPSSATPSASSPPALAPPPVPLPACDARPSLLQPIPVDEAAWQARPWAGVTRLSELLTTLERPILACGVAGSAAYLATLRCQDGSTPSDEGVTTAGPGGACGHLLDRHRLVCPEGARDVFVDIYWCVDPTRFDPPASSDAPS
ncbi:MAG: hypothetical protein R3B72_28990 [Polyangiaceae bacterium]